MNSSPATKPNFLFFWKKAKQILAMPTLVMLSIILGHLVYLNYLSIITDQTNGFIMIAENSIYCLGLALTFYWFLVKIIASFTRYLLSTDLLQTHQTIRILIPFFATMLKTIAILVILNLTIPYLGLPHELSYVMDKLSSILIILAISWILIKLVQIAEQLLLYYYPAQASQTVIGRKIHTQTLILKRVALSIIFILTIGSILMLFENVRTLGASVLTTAGIIGLVLTVAAQRSLGSVFAGLELALVQPIKLGDMIIIEQEMGIVEEINFRNVVIKLWDWRRLIVPTTFFLDKPFQNWSREQSNNLIGTVFLHVDFTLPVSALREELGAILKLSPLWDGKISTIQVTDSQERVMQLRILCSARNPTDAWNLRCEVREKLIDYIVKNYPQSLPATRTRGTIRDGNMVLPIDQ